MEKEERVKRVDNQLLKEVIQVEGHLELKMAEVVVDTLLFLKEESMLETPF